MRAMTLLLPLLAGGVACGGGSGDGAVRTDDSAARTSTPSTTLPTVTPVARVAFRVPADSEIADSVILASMVRGRALHRNTRDSLPRHVGNRLTCTNCHTRDGTQKDVMPLVGVYARFPQYRARSGTVQIIEDRINDCFERSMNGKGLPRDGRDMRDMVNYLAFLSIGVPVGAQMEGQGMPPVKPLPPDTARGQALFAAECARCHGADGTTSVPGVPPLWGPHSFNVGAGMARIRTMAAFVRHAMPLDKPGTLTDQQAYDVAAYVNSRPRPDFVGKELDWPNADPPPDVAYPTRAARAKRGSP